MVDFPLLLLITLEDITYGLNLESVSCPGDTDGTAHESCLGRLLDKPRFDEALDASYETSLFARLFAGVVCGDAIAEGKLTREGLIVANGTYRYRGTEGGKVASRTTCEAISNDGLGINLIDTADSLLS